MESVWILMDSNAYFRLAQNIHPLLKTSFGKNPRYTIGVIQELDAEYNRSPRLQSKFYWVSQTKYAENRSECFNLTRDQKALIEQAFYFLRDFNRDERLSASQVDLRCLAHAYELKIPLVTDDPDMMLIAKEFEIELWGVLRLLRLMVDSGFILEDKAEEITDLWKYLNDVPTNFHRDIKKLFPDFGSKKNTDAPKSYS